MPLVLEINRQQHLTVINRLTKTRVALTEFLGNKNTVTATNLIVWWELLLSRLAGAYPFTGFYHEDDPSQPSSQRNKTTYSTGWIEVEGEKFSSEVFDNQPNTIGLDAAFIASFLDYLEDDFLPTINSDQITSPRKVLE